MKKPSKKPARKSPSSTSAAMHIRLPARQLAFARRRAAAGGYAKVDDYVAALVSLDQELEGLDQEMARAKPSFRVDSEEDLAQKVREAIEVGGFREVTPQWWAEVRAEVRKKVEQARGRKRRRPRSP